MFVLPRCAEATTLLPSVAFDLCIKLYFFLIKYVLRYRSKKKV
jgi:hypothetical protein